MDGVVKSYEDIAEREKLEPETAKRYCKYMRLVYGKEAEAKNVAISYATEWANRFKNKQEYMKADPTGQAVLAKMDRGLI